ncbi:MAG: response regulator [Chloroflexi bacterium]|nr:response regulator [Chloroflexota bacterium]
MTDLSPDPFAVDVLHDLNHCLELIAGFVELAEEALYDGDAASTKARLTLAAHAAQQAQTTAESPALNPAESPALDPSLVEVPVKPTPSRGSCFQLNSPSRPRRRAVRPLRVLVVEDSSTLRHMFTIILRRVGYVVHAVALGSEALSLLQDGNFDVMVSDLSLGSGLSGLDLAYAVRQLAPNTRFILATGSIEGLSVEDCAQFGVDAVLTKPFTPTQLRVAVAEVLNHR